MSGRSSTNDYSSYVDEPLDDDRLPPPPTRASYSRTPPPPSQSSRAGGGGFGGGDSDSSGGGTDDSGSYDSIDDGERSVIYRGEHETLFLGEHELTLEWTTGKASRSLNVNSLPLNQVAFLNITQASTWWLPHLALLIGLVVPLFIEGTFRISHRDLVGEGFDSLGLMQDPVGHYACGVSLPEGVPPTRKGPSFTSTEPLCDLKLGPMFYNTSFLGSQGVGKVEIKWPDLPDKLDWSLESFTFQSEVERFGEFYVTTVGEGHKLNASWSEFWSNSHNGTMRHCHNISETLPDNASHNYHVVKYGGYIPTKFTPAADTNGGTVHFPFGAADDQDCSHGAGSDACICQVLKDVLNIKPSSLRLDYTLGAVACEILPRPDISGFLADDCHMLTASFQPHALTPPAPAPGPNSWSGEGLMDETRLGPSSLSQAATGAHSFKLRCGVSGSNTLSDVCAARPGRVWMGLLPRAPVSLGCLCIAALLWGLYSWTSRTTLVAGSSRSAGIGTVGTLHLHLQDGDESASERADTILRKIHEGRAAAMHSREPKPRPCSYDGGSPPTDGPERAEKLWTDDTATLKMTDQELVLEYLTGRCTRSKNAASLPLDNIVHMAMLSRAKPWVVLAVLACASVPFLIELLDIGPAVSQPNITQMEHCAELDCDNDEGRKTFVVVTSTVSIMVALSFVGYYIRTMKTTVRHHATSFPLCGVYGVYGG